MSSIKLKHSGGNSVSLNPPTSAPTSSDVAFKLPNADGSSGQYMKTDGSGNLAFATVATPTVQPTVWDTWILTSGISNYEGDLTTAGIGSAPPFARPPALSNGIAWGTIGTGMTESGGVFTFPQTGLWIIEADFQIDSNTSQQYSIGRIEASNDSGSSYDTFAESGNAAPAYGTYGIHASGLMDVTNASTFRIKFSMHVTANWTSGHTVSGTSSYKKSGFQFIRVGDT